MDKRVLRERMRRKRRQLMIRKIMKLTTIVIAAIFLVVLVFRGIIRPIAENLGKGSGTASTLEADAELLESVKKAAVLIPVNF